MLGKVCKNALRAGTLVVLAASIGLAMPAGAVLAAQGAGAAGLDASAPSRTVRVAPAGVDPNGVSGQPSFGGNSGFLAFASTATNLGPSVGIRRISNIYVYDIFTGQVGLVSGGVDSRPVNGPSTSPAMSADGRTIAFVSSATNLTSGTPKHVPEIFALTAGSPMRLISVGFGGVQPDADSSQPAISANGQYVVFTSDADNLVAGDDNASSDIFRADLLDGQITRVSISSAGHQANGDSYNPSISANGQLISFTSNAANLVPGDHNHVADVFVRDVLTGTTRRVSVSSGGREQNQSVAAPFEQVSDVSADGRYVVFDSNATNLARIVAGHTNVFRHDLRTGATTLLSSSSLGAPGDNDSFAPATSADGGVTVFESFADNLATPSAASENVFFRQSAASTTSTVDVTPGGQPRGPEVDQQLLQQAAISANGAFAAFTSGADNLVADDDNGLDDLFIRLITPPTTTVITPPPPVTGDPRPRVEFGTMTPLAGPTGVCVLDEKRSVCPIGTSFRLPRLRRGPHVLRVYAAGAGTQFDPVGVTVHFKES
jgi:Tol biopolymer transport system component